MSLKNPPFAVLLLDAFDPTTLITLVFNPSKEGSGGMGHVGQCGECSHVTMFALSCLSDD